MSEAFDRLQEKRQQVSKGMTFVIIGAFFLLMPPVGLALILIGYSKVQSAKREMKGLYKEAFVREPLMRNFENVFYEPEQGFPQESVASFGLCRMGNRFSSEDYIRASYHGVWFEVSDVSVWDVDTSTDNRTTSTEIYFKGRMMVFDFPDKLVSSILIYSRTFKHRALSQREGKKDKTELESVAFNNTFDVYSAAPHDVFYLLTPPLMERLQYLASKYQSIAMLIFGNRVILAFSEPDNNAFDAKVDIGKVVYEDEMAKVQGDIDDIRAFIDLIVCP